MRTLRVTTANNKAFSLRLEPSNRVFRLIRTKRYGKPKARAIFTAKVVANGLEKAAQRGQFTEFEMTNSILPEALYMADQQPVRNYKGSTVFIREVNIN